MWRGSATTFEDLHKATEQDRLNVGSSAAEAVDEFGTVAGIAGDRLALWMPRRVGEPILLRATQIHVPEGWMLFQGSVLPGKTYRAEMSSDLDSWKEIRTAKSATGWFTRRSKPRHWRKEHFSG